MKTITITADDKLIDNILNLIKSLKNVGNKIKNQARDDEFRIDEDYLLKSLKKIEKGDFSDCTEMTADEHFKELGI